MLVQWVSGRRVLHVGFADHVPLIASRVADGSSLHACQVTVAGSAKGRVLRSLTQWRPIWSDVLLVRANAR